MSEQGLIRFPLFSSVFLRFSPFRQGIRRGDVVIVFDPKGDIRKPDYEQINRYERADG
jgi:hypothetical protein